MFRWSSGWHWDSGPTPFIHIERSSYDHRYFLLDADFLRLCDLILNCSNGKTYWWDNTPISTRKACHCTDSENNDEQPRQLTRNAASSSRISNLMRPIHILSQTILTRTTTWDDLRDISWHLASRTYAKSKIKKGSYLWQDMERNIWSWVKGCLRCQQHKIFGHTRVETILFFLPLGRFETVHIDITSPLLPTATDTVYSYHQFW